MTYLLTNYRLWLYLFWDLQGDLSTRRLPLE
jgi:hypothetical protein